MPDAAALAQSSAAREKREKKFGGFDFFAYLCIVKH